MLQKLTLDYAEFYITNVCNLTCNGCNRFNSFRFKGWQKWDDYAEQYTQWSKELNISRIAIMGGEPLLNPSFYDWIDNIVKLWPQAFVHIASNGTQLDHHQQLYARLQSNKKLKYSVSIHNKKHKQQIIQRVEKFLTAPLSYNFHNEKYRELLTITDSNGVTVVIDYNWWFHQGAIITDPDSGKLTLHNSDPDKSHKICHSKTCHHFDRGRLYKCGPAALFAPFDQQFGLQLTDQDRALINSVNSVGVQNSLIEKQQFLRAIKNPIPQCKFCPEEYQGKQIFAIEKKDAV